MMRKMQSEDLSLEVVHPDAAGMLYLDDNVPFCPR